MGRVAAQGDQEGAPFPTPIPPVAMSPHKRPSQSLASGQSRDNSSSRASTSQSSLDTVGHLLFPEYGRAYLASGEHPPPRSLSHNGDRTREGLSNGRQIRDNHFKLSCLLLAASSDGASGPADSWKEPPSQVRQAKVGHRDHLCSLSMGLQGPQKPVPHQQIETQARAALQQSQLSSGALEGNRCRLPSLSWLTGLTNHSGHRRLQREEEEALLGDLQVQASSSFLIQGTVLGLTTAAQCAHSSRDPSARTAFYREHESPPLLQVPLAGQLLED